VKTLGSVSFSYAGFRGRGTVGNLFVFIYFFSISTHTGNKYVGKSAAVRILWWQREREEGDP